MPLLFSSLLWIISRKKPHKEQSTCGNQHSRKQKGKNPRHKLLIQGIYSVPNIKWRRFEKRFHRKRSHNVRLWRYFSSNSWHQDILWHIFKGNCRKQRGRNRLTMIRKESVVPYISSRGRNTNIFILSCFSFIHYHFLKRI